jgi:hypothetical protein
VRFPNKEALTLPGKKLGPQIYHAPEMLTNPESAAGGPADVWSLAKTLWKLAAGAKWPLPGHQRWDEPLATLNVYVEHPRLQPLNLLVDRATLIDPSARPTMREFASELMNWLTPTAKPISATDFSAFRNEFAEVLDKNQQIRADRKRRREELQRIMGLLSPMITELAAEYARTNLQIHVGVTAFVNDHRPNPTEKFEGIEHYDVHASFQGAMLFSTVFGQVASNDTAVLSVGHFVALGNHRIVHEWWAQKTIRLSSAEEAHAIADPHNELFEASQEAMEVFRRASKNTLRPPN